MTGRCRKRGTKSQWAMLPVWQIADVKSVCPDNHNRQVRLLRRARNR
jgi:hypothetical protein